MPTIYQMPGLNPPAPVDPVAHLQARVEVLRQAVGQKGFAVEKAVDATAVGCNDKAHDYCWAAPENIGHLKDYGYRVVPAKEWEILGRYDHEADKAANRIALNGDPKNGVLMRAPKGVRELRIEVAALQATRALPRARDDQRGLVEESTPAMAGVHAQFDRDADAFRRGFAPIQVPLDTTVEPPEGAEASA